MLEYLEVKVNYMCKFILVMQTLNMDTLAKYIHFSNCAVMKPDKLVESIDVRVRNAT